MIERAGDYDELSGLTVPVVTKIALERIPVYSRMTFPEEMLLDAKIQKHEVAELVIERLTYSLVTYMVGVPDEEKVVVAHAEKVAYNGEWVRWPKDWKSAWRASLSGRFGEWVRRRWPVEYAEKQVRVEARAVAHAEERYHAFKAVCPHIRVPGQSRHVEFLSAHYTPLRGEGR